jgi:hypothetical protein
MDMNQHAGTNARQFFNCQKVACQILSGPDWRSFFLEPNAELLNSWKKKIKSSIEPERSFLKKKWRHSLLLTGPPIRPMIGHQK